MRIKILIMAVVLAGLLFSMSASAAEITPACGEVALQRLNFGDTATFDKFDPSLGTLNSVTLDAQACAQGSRVLTNEDVNPLGVDYQVTLSATLTATIPGFGPQIFPISATDNFHLGPGESHTITIGPECFPKIFTLPPPPQLALYEGVGQVSVPVNTISGITVNGSTEWSSTGSTFMSFEICPTYEYTPPLCINGTKINDCTEAGIPGWQITLKDSNGAVIGSQPTGADGDYSFCELMPGDYQVCEETRAGWTNMDATCKDVTLDEDSAEGVDFVNAPLVCISGHKFDSRTNAGLSGWTIQLKDASGAVLKTTTTGTGGLYQFCDLVPGSSYTVCEVQKAGWKAIGPTCIPVELVACENTENVDFFNEPTNLVCVCPFFIKNDLYTTSCHAVYEVDAAHGILANDPAGSIVLNPELITIDPKYGTITVEEDGSFVYDPTGATGITRSGVYVMFNYAANNGLCDSRYLGLAKIQVSCK